MRHLLDSPASIILVPCAIAAVLLAGWGAGILAKAVVDFARGWRDARRVLAQADADARHWESVARMLATSECPYCHGTAMDAGECECEARGCGRAWCPRYDAEAGCAPGRWCGPGCECGRPA